MQEEKNNNETGKINREFKDRIFRYIFAHEKNRELTLSLYNAVSGKNYTNPDDMEITTLNDVLYMSMKNDLSFIIDDTMNIYEHQSSVNPNMPVRMLLYAADVYCTLYQITPEGKYEVSFEWDDSILVDVETELNKRITLMQNGITSKLENRMWYFGETEDQARQALAKIQEENNQSMENQLALNYGFGTKGE